MAIPTLAEQTDQLMAWLEEHYVQTGLYPSIQAMFSQDALDEATQLSGSMDERDLVEAYLKQAQQQFWRYAQDTDNHPGLMDHLYSDMTPLDLNQRLFVEGAFGASQSIQSEINADQLLEQSQPAPSPAAEAIHEEARTDEDVPQQTAPEVSQETADITATQTTSTESDSEVDAEIVVNEQDLRLASGRTAEEVNSDAQTRVNERFAQNGQISARQAYRIVRDELGHDNVALRIDEADTITLASPSLHEHGVMAFWPAFQIASTGSNYTMLPDKFSNEVGQTEGEMQLQTVGGVFPVADQFALAYLAKNHALPGEFVTHNNGSIALNFSTNEPEIESLLPEISEEDKATLLAGNQQVAMFGSFDIQTYQQWHDWVHNPETSISAENARYKLSDQSITMIPTEQLYGEVYEQHGLNSEGAQSMLQLYSHGVSIRDYERFAEEAYLQESFLRFDDDGLLELARDYSATQQRSQSNETLSADLDITLYFEEVREERLQHLESFESISETTNLSSKHATKVLEMLAEIECEKTKLQLEVLTSNGSSELSGSIRTQLAQTLEIEKDNAQKISYLIDTHPELLGELRAHSQSDTQISHLLESYQELLSTEDKTLGQIEELVRQGHSRTDPTFATTTASVETALLAHTPGLQLATEVGGAMLGLGISHQSVSEPFSRKLNGDLRADISADIKLAGVFSNRMPVNSTVEDHIVLPTEYNATTQENSSAAASLAWHYDDNAALAVGAEFRTDALGNSQSTYVESQFGQWNEGAVHGALRAEVPHLSYRNIDEQHWRTNFGVGGSLELEPKLTRNHITFSTSGGIAEASILEGEQPNKTALTANIGGQTQFSSERFSIALSGNHAAYDLGGVEAPTRGINTGHYQLGYNAGNIASIETHGVLISMPNELSLYQIGAGLDLAPNNAPAHHLDASYGQFKRFGQGLSPDITQPFMELGYGITANDVSFDFALRPPVTVGETEINQGANQPLVRAGISITR